MDHALLSALVDRELFELTEIRGHEWDPLVHNPGPLLHALLSRPYAPVEVRLAALAAASPRSRMRWPATLRDMPRIHAETAVGQFTGVAALIRDEVPHCSRGPGRDPRLGRRRWEARLWHTLDTELSAAEIQRRAWANLDRVTDEIRAAAVELVGGPADDETVRRALDLLAAEHPDDHTIVDLASITLDEASDVVRAHDLVTVRTTRASSR